MKSAAKVKEIPATTTEPMKAVQKLPTLEELVLHSEDTMKQNALMVLLNQPPSEKWIKEHPMVAGHKYIPISRIEFLLSAIFGKWWVEVRSTSIMANSICVTVRLYVINPINGETEWQDGVGAAPIQTDKGKGATDWNYVKASGVQMALPIAESYAIKDSAEKFGKLFGKDLNRKEEIGYNNLLNKQVDLDELKELYELKKESLTTDEQYAAERIIQNQETASYKKLFNQLQNK